MGEQGYHLLVKFQLLQASSQSHFAETALPRVRWKVLALTQGQAAGILALSTLDLKNKLPQGPSWWLNTKYAWPVLKGEQCTM